MRLADNPLPVVLTLAVFAGAATVASSHLGSAAAPSGATPQTYDLPMPAPGVVNVEGSVSVANTPTVFERCRPACGR